MFIPYTKHEQEKENIIQKILEMAQNGEENISIELDNNFSKEDIDYIKKEVYRRLR